MGLYEGVNTASVFDGVARYSAGKGQWITIGGSKGEDGSRHGGSPVFIQDGRIVKGHPSLTGKKIDALKEEGDSEDAVPFQRQGSPVRYASLYEGRR